VRPSDRVRARPIALLVACLACGQPRPEPAPPPRADAIESTVAALADSILAAARARDAGRFVAHFAPGEQLRYVLNTRAPIGRDALRDAFGGMLARQASFDPRWTDAQVQVVSPEVAVFTGAFRTAARDTSGRAWGAQGIVTFVARHGPSGWLVVNWHTSEAAVTP
jgi:uncharacterized protein (TIGR02246 family)